MKIGVATEVIETDILAHREETGRGALMIEEGTGMTDGDDMMMRTGEMKGIEGTIRGIIGQRLEPPSRLQRPKPGEAFRWRSILYWQRRWMWPKSSPRLYPSSPSHPSPQSKYINSVLILF
jgi:hypothetical protein